jgi:hypothetical protein
MLLLAQMSELPGSHDLQLVWSNGQEYALAKISKWEDETARQHVAFLLPRSVFKVFEDFLILEHGTNLALLSQADPNEAYEQLTNFCERIAQFAGHTMLDERMIHYVLEDPPDLGPEFEQVGIDTDTDAATVTVAVFQQRSLLDKLRLRETPPKQVAEFQVEPPDLAF